MNCPMCADQRLEPRIHSGIEIDVCRGCRGIWLDRGELSKLIERQRPTGTTPEWNAVSDGAVPDGAVSDGAVSDGAEADPPASRSGSKRRKSWGQRLADILEEIVD